MVGLTELCAMFKMKDIRVSWLLQAWWIAGILPILIASIPSSRLASFHHLVLGFARRGKIMTSSNSSQKFWIEKFTVPQKFFLHFYVFSVVWTTTLLALTWHYAYKRYWVWRLVFLLLLMEIQVVSRLYETLYVFKYSHSARMQIFAYFTGYYFYVAVPLSLCHGCVLEILNFAADQVAELSVMGQEKVSVIEYDFWGYLKPMAKLGWCQLVGAAVFFWGWVHQRNCHAIFGSLRRHKTDRDKHVIPRGDWFDYVSSPHYFAEMVIYAGIVIASGGTDLTIFLAFAFTVANLSFVAGEIHRWYLKKFVDYPQNRKAVIPFIY